LQLNNLDTQKASFFVLFSNYFSNEYKQFKATIYEFPQDFPTLISKWS